MNHLQPKTYNLLPITYSLKPKTYKSIFLVAFFILFSLLALNSAHASCSSVPLRGDYTVSSSCTLPVHGNIGGVDNGGITINSGQTLTVNAGQTIVWGPGKSLIINGSIAIANGAQLKQGRICRTDADGDGYITDEAPTVALTCTGKITQSDIDNSLTTWDDISYDYNDESDTVYPGTACNGDCSINNSSGECVAKSAGENGLPACQRCNGSSLTHVNVSNNTQDTEGSNVCNQTCKKCNGTGSCVNQASGENLFSQCSGAYTCSGYTTRLRNMCNGSGACAAIDASASDCSGICASYCSGGSCISTDTGTGTCTVSTNARVASGGDGSCSSGTCAGTIIDDFEDNNLDEYSYYDSGPTNSVPNSHEIISSGAYEGNYALKIDAGYGTGPVGTAGAQRLVYSTSGLSHYPSQGDSFDVYVYLHGAYINSGVAFGLQDKDNYYLAEIMNESSDILALVKVESGRFTLLAGEFGNAFPPDGEWLRLHVDWGSDGTITITLYDSGETQLGQVSAQDTTYSGGGVGFRHANYVSLDDYMYVDYMK